MTRFHIDMSKPAKGEIFVFGSNRAGIHGAGAARYALKFYGANWGVGEGLVKDSYAIPTKGYSIERISLNEIKTHVDRFIEFVIDHSHRSFFITRVGCGLAGHKDQAIAPLFNRLVEVETCSFPVEWEQYLTGVLTHSHLLA